MCAHVSARVRVCVCACVCVVCVLRTHRYLQFFHGAVSRLHVIACVCSARLRDQLKVCVAAVALFASMALIAPPKVLSAHVYCAELTHVGVHAS